MANENPSWAYIDKEILHCVAERLSFVDQARFRSVCKAWREIRGEKPNDKSPWILAVTQEIMRVYSPRISSPQRYHLYDVSARKAYTLSIDQPSLRKRFDYVSDRNVRCIKSGWLLLNLRDSQGLVLFNAFTQEVVDLPGFPGKQRNFVLTFSYHARSRQFVVYAANRSVADDKSILINTWKSGDREWETNEFAPEIGGFMNHVFKIECVGDTLYCVFTSGVVGTFQGRKNWSVLVKSGKDVKYFSSSDSGPWLIFISARLLEIEGDLFLVSCGRYDHHKWDILQLDREGQTWVEDIRFPEQALYFANASVLASKQSAGEAGAGCIYYCDGGDCVEFNGATNETDGPVPWLERKLFEFPWYEWDFKFPNFMLEANWIEPPTL